MASITAIIIVVSLVTRSTMSIVLLVTRGAELTSHGIIHSLLLSLELLYGFLPLRKSEPLLHLLIDLGPIQNDRLADDSCDGVCLLLDWLLPLRDVGMGVQIVSLSSVFLAEVL